MNLFGFTSQEYMVIEELMKLSKDIYITICRDKEEAINEDSDIARKLQ